MSHSTIEIPQFQPFTKAWHNTTYPAIDPSRPELSAKGKNVVITGGGTGIGAGVALSFAQAGVSSISILGRREELLQKTKARIESQFPGVSVFAYAADVTCVGDIKTSFADIHARVGSIDVYVNNAGALQGDSRIKEVSIEDWWSVFEVNVKGSLVTTQAFLQYAAPYATIINMSSIAAYVWFGPNYSSYSASKLAGINFFATVQKENPDLKVVSVHPGVIDTSMTRKTGLPIQDDGTFSNKLHSN